MRFESFMKKLREFAFGFFVFDPLITIKKILWMINMAFMDITIGDMLGIPILPPLYRLKLLPYWYPNIERWRNMRMREYDVTDLIRE